MLFRLGQNREREREREKEKHSHCEAVRIVSSRSVESVPGYQSDGNVHVHRGTSIVVLTQFHACKRGTSIAVLNVR